MSPLILPLTVKYLQDNYKFSLPFFHEDQFSVLWF